MKRSESKSYIEYGRAMGRDNYRKALGHLLDFISEYQGEMEVHERVDMTQRIGKIYFHLGDPNLALFFFKIGMDCAPTSLLARLTFAKFVGRDLKKIDLAVQICDEIIALAELDPQPDSEEDFCSDWYIENTKQLKAELTADSNG
jgi:hypothetical protein